MFEEILRGMVCEESGAQKCFYFENTVENVGNFVFKYVSAGKKVLLMDIFGNIVMDVSKDGEISQCRSNKCRGNVTEYLAKLRDGQVKPSSITYLEMKDVKDKDKDLYSKDVQDKLYERLV